MLSLMAMESVGVLSRSLFFFRPDPPLALFVFAAVPYLSDYIEILRSSN